MKTENKLSYEIHLWLTEIYFLTECAKFLKKQLKIKKKQRLVFKKLTTNLKTHNDQYF